jgi:acetyl-CoA carboxylase biotin carboxyl carrier protein
MAVASPVVATSNVASMPRAEAPSKSASSTNSATVVPTPMAGTFYQAPNPEAAPFVQIGDEVQPGDVLCIVESMKMMHEIKATTGGTVNAILVANGQPISTGDALFELS